MSLSSHIAKGAMRQHDSSAAIAALRADSFLIRWMTQIRPYPLTLGGLFALVAVYDMDN
jgi:hypothetical protein